MLLTEVNIYPIKSTRAISLAEGVVTARGLQGDRRWMLVDDAGTFITARQYPVLAMVSTQLLGDTLHVIAPGMPELTVPLAPQDGEQVRVQIWRQDCDATAFGSQYDQWFADYLDTSCRLVHMADAQVRGVDPLYGQPGDHVSFADGFPLLLISAASLEDLNGRLSAPVPMSRFRPNVVVSGCEAFAEDNWRRLRIGPVEFEGVKACSRCVFTTIDPDTGSKDPGREPLRTLATYRRRPEGGVFFGQNLIPRAEGVIRVGDPVDVLE